MIVGVSFDHWQIGLLGASFAPVIALMTTMTHSDDELEQQY